MKSIVVGFNSNGSDLVFDVFDGKLDIGSKVCYNSIVGVGHNKNDIFELLDMEGLLNKNNPISFQKNYVSRALECVFGE